jgi:hypothetical protein
MDCMKEETMAEKKDFHRNKTLIESSRKRKKVKNELKSQLLCRYIPANKVLDLK